MTSIGQVDRKATKETRALYQHLFDLRTKGVMFGHQDALAYGLNADLTRWIGGVNHSDIMTITGAHPAVVGHDLGHLELGQEKNLDEVPFNSMRQSILQVYKNGGINTLSWHPNNPLDLSKTTWDKMDSTIEKVLNNRKHLKAYKKILSKLATYIKSLKGPEGELIPVIFRPYHEHTGSWFWWGAAHCTADEYKAFWQMTVDYLIRKKKVHNILYAYSTDNFNSEEHYLERFPGENDWWTRIVYPIISDSGLSYILVWRNGRPDHFYAPYPGHSSQEDFIRFFNLPGTLFEKDLDNLYH